MSDLARQLIAENKRTRAIFLDLGRCGLGEIPEEIGELTWLELVSFADSWADGEGQYTTTGNSGDPNESLADLAPLAALAALKFLHLRGTHVSDLAPLSGLTGLRTLDASRTQVADLTPLARLSALETLELSSTPVANVAPLAGLERLQTLRLSDTEVSELGGLAGLTRLETLDVSRIKASDLSPLAGATRLQALTIGSDGLSDLRPLAGMSQLQRLHVSGSQVSDLRPLAALSEIRVLSFVFATTLTDLGPLAGLARLESLMLIGAPVRDLAPLAHLGELQTLFISGAPVTDLTPLKGHTKLRGLMVTGAQVATLSPLAGLGALEVLDISNSPVTDIRPLAALSQLRSLDVAKTQVDDLTPLRGLTGLAELNLSGTRVSDLGPLADLGQLTMLDASNTRVAHLAPLAALTMLATLRLSDALVGDLTPLASLASLSILDLVRTPVADLSPLRALLAAGLPALWSDRGWERGVHLEGCPLTNPPPEIVKQGNDAILNYFSERDAAGVDRLYEAKLLILGEGGAGKTSLLRRMFQPDLPLPATRETTKGIAIHRHEFPLKNGRRFRLNVWDFGGQEIYHATHQFFLTRRSLYLLLDDTGKDHKSVSDPGFKYWLEVIDVFGGRSPVLIFQNEKGGRSKAIDLAGIQGHYENVKQLYAGNLEQPGSADRARDAVEYFASSLGHVGDELPAPWIKVRADIEARAGEAPHITFAEYLEIYSRHLPRDRVKALHLSRYLHDLGVFLHFQDHQLLRGTVILQNEWATEAVFRVLDNEEVKAKQGRFDERDCERVWADSKYADMHPQLLALMQQFELCYELPDTSPRAWLAPQLLSPIRPAQLAARGTGDSLVLRYKYKLLPKGVIGRLTVRLHRLVRDTELAWITGVRFDRGASSVLVERLANGSELELRAQGPERKALLSVVAADLDALNDSVPGLRDKVDKRIPCTCQVCRVASEPHFFDERALLKRKEHQRLSVECEESLEQVSVLELLDGIRGDALPGWAAELKAPAAAVRRVRIFLASSNELLDDRDDFELFVRKQNDRLLSQGLHLQIERWEDSLAAMSLTRSQDEYNKAVCAADIFVSLFFTRAGTFTTEEFEVARESFVLTGKPLVYTFFKNAAVNMGDIGDEVVPLLAFKKRLSSLKHFWTNYSDMEDLNQKFRRQLDLLFPG